MTTSPAGEVTSGPLLRAWLLGVAAVAPLFVAVGLGALALDPEGDTAPLWLASPDQCRALAGSEDAGSRAPGAARRARGSSGGL